jgi:hypothetical protein
MTIDPGLPLLGFAVLGVVAGLARRGNVDNRRLVNVFIVYTLALGLAAGLAQRRSGRFRLAAGAGKVPYR